MPESDYMNNVQLDFFRCILETSLQEVAASLQQQREGIDSTEHAPDETDRASMEEARSVASSIIERLSLRATLIKTAIARIDNGEYGYCLATGEKIGLARLIANPTANLTLEAQSKHERQRQQFA